MACPSPLLVGMPSTTSRLALALGLMLAPADAVGAPAPKLDAWEVEYTLVGKLRLSDTTMGAGDGIHEIGPGIVVLRFDDVGGEPGGKVRVSRYELATRFTVNAYVLGFGTTVLNDTRTRATPGALGYSAEGVVGADHVIRWTGPWNNIHTDGNLTCSGSMCSKFGAPPEGRSPFHTGLHAAQFKPFKLTSNNRVFRMDYVVMNKSSNHTASILLEGRETRRTSVRASGSP